MDINKLKREHQKNVAKIAALEATLVQYDGQRTAAVDKVIASFEVRLATLTDATMIEMIAEKKAHAETTTTCHEMIAQRNDLSERCVDLKHELNRTTQALADEQMRSRGLADTLLGEEPKRAALELVIQDLTNLLAKVQDRMRRKELEEQNAILNRVALVNAVPARNRRG